MSYVFFIDLPGMSSEDEGPYGHRPMEVSPHLTGAPKGKGKKGKKSLHPSSQGSLNNKYYVYIKLMHYTYIFYKIRCCAHDDICM